MNSKRKFGLHTSLIHSHLGNPEHPVDPFCSHKEPIYQTTTFKFESLEQVEAVLEGKIKHDMYSRLSNPNHRSLEESLRNLDHGEISQVFCSGMGAIATAIDTLVLAGEEIIAHRNLYGCTYTYLRNLLKYSGKNVKFVDAMDVKNVLSQITNRTVMVLGEFPSNPNLDIWDFEEIKEGLKYIGRPDVLVVVDSTFGTPYNVRPLNHGADIVIHSATKYFGKGRVFGGVITTSNKIMERVWERYVGQSCMDPRVSWEILGNVADFPLRMERHNSNAEYIAGYLRYHPKVKRVYYPGLDNHPNHTIARRLMKTPFGNPAFGGMISFELNGTVNETRKFLYQLAKDQINGKRIISLLVSLGTMDTIICSPAFMTHGKISREERLMMGISDELIRLSVGAEDVDDIIYSLDRGFEVI